jgi:hypothetical protein
MGNVIVLSTLTMSDIKRALKLKCNMKKNGVVFEGILIEEAHEMYVPIDFIEDMLGLKVINPEVVNT